MYVCIYLCMYVCTYAIMHVSRPQVLLPVAMMEPVASVPCSIWQESLLVQN